MEGWKETECWWWKDYIPTGFKFKDSKVTLFPPRSSIVTVNLIGWLLTLLSLECTKNKTFIHLNRRENSKKNTLKISFPVVKFSSRLFRSTVSARGQKQSGHEQAGLQYFARGRSGGLMLIRVFRSSEASSWLNYWEQNFKLHPQKHLQPFSADSL